MNDTFTQNTKLIILSFRHLLFIHAGEISSILFIEYIFLFHSLHKIQLLIAIIERYLSSSSFFVI
jgi:hypothetical protein